MTFCLLLLVVFSRESLGFPMSCAFAPVFVEVPAGLVSSRRARDVTLDLMGPCFKPAL